MCLPPCTTTRDDIRKSGPSSLANDHNLYSERRLGVPAPSPFSTLGVIAAAAASANAAATRIIPTH
jgi:hypothetical protein